MAFADEGDSARQVARSETVLLVHRAAGGMDARPRAGHSDGVALVGDGSSHSINDSRKGRLESELFDGPATGQPQIPEPAPPIQQIRAIPIPEQELT